MNFFFLIYVNQHFATSFSDKLSDTTAKDHTLLFGAEDFVAQLSFINEYVAQSFL